MMTYLEGIKSFGLLHLDWYGLVYRPKAPVDVEYLISRKPTTVFDVRTWIGQVVVPLGCSLASGADRC